MDLDYLKAEIARQRLQIKRQQRDILDLQRAGIDASSAQALLARMQERVDRLCLDRERLAGEERMRVGRVGKGTPAKRRA